MNNAPKPDNQGITPDYLRDSSNLNFKQLIPQVFPKPSKLDEILDLHMAFKTEQGVLYSQLSTAQTKSHILALIEEVIGPDEKDDGFYSKEYIKHVNGEKARQRLRKDAL